MIPAARVAAAIEILNDIEEKRRPAAESIKDWGIAHRFAGSGDRSAIAGLIYDALRRKASSAWIMGETGARAGVIGALKQLRALSVDEIARLLTGEGHAPPPLSALEQDRLANGALDDAPAHVRGDYPEWLSAAFEASFGAQAADEGRALAERAPVDLRVNTLKGDRNKALASLAHLQPVATPFSPIGLRIAITPEGRGQRWPPSRPMPKAWWKCRTKAPNWRRCFRAPSRARRFWTYVLEQAARVSRSPR
jgi:16S rRNA (cytosine967-C5)-methyltransferase